MINPVSLPTSAAVNYGEGDVRHFSEGDEVGVPGLQGPTRHLAERDNQIATKLNEVIGQVNNQEQFISVPVNRIIVPPSIEEIIANFRISTGYECRVFNATVFSYPASSAIELNVYYSAVVGSNTGESAVSTTSEFYTGTKFYPEGEFIITVKNTGAVSLEMGASVTLTMRPLDETVIAAYQTSVPSVPGPPGPRGGTGGKGDGGSAGAAGAAGLQWKGNWVTAQSYSVNDIVRHDFPDAGGTSGMSSYICLVSHNSAATGEPQPSVIDQGPTYMPWWGYLAQAGEPYPQVTWQSTWSAGHGTYHLNDVVSYVVSGATSSYICTAAHVSDGSKLPTNTAYWAVFASSSAAGVSFSTTSRSGFMQCDKTSSTSGAYAGIPSTANITQAVDEFAVTAGGAGLGFITQQNLVVLPPLSNLQLVLPNYTGLPVGAYQWLVSEVNLDVIPHGKDQVFAGTLVISNPTTTYQGNGSINYLITNTVDAPMPVSISLLGVRKS
jgi:hypothetical protein